MAVLNMRPTSSLVAIGAFVSVVCFIIFRGAWSVSIPVETSNGNANANKPDMPYWKTNVANINTNSELGRASNGTLGFEKIIVVGLKERYDRRDAIALQSTLTGFHVEYEDGMRGEDVVTKALPPGMDRTTRPQGYIGSWRAHLNAIRRVVDEGLSSALIIEDDVDWDIRILAQMQDFAKGTRHLTDVPQNAKQHSPYGDNWDVLWPGHCGGHPVVGDNRQYVIPNDPTVPPKEHQHPLADALVNMPEGTRVVHRAGEPICTFAYAISYEGAQKVIAEVAMVGTPVSFDNDLAFMCRDRVLDVRCYMAEPSLFVHHRPAGNVAKDSDLVANDGAAVREKGSTENIAISARLNLRKLMVGETDYVMQW